MQQRWITRCQEVGDTVEVSRDEHQRTIVAPLQQMVKAGRQQGQTVQLRSAFAKLVNHKQRMAWWSLQSKGHLTEIK